MESCDGGVAPTAVCRTYTTGRLRDPHFLWDLKASSETALWLRTGPTGWNYPPPSAGQYRKETQKTKKESPTCGDSNELISHNLTNMVLQNRDDILDKPGMLMLPTIVQWRWMD